jgi:hypothetical protein
MQADAQIRLELLFERAGDSMGAFERATNTLYGSQQLLNASLQNLQIAAGAPLQEPLAAINNIFTAIISENGEQIVEVFEEMGNTVDLAAPAVETLGTTLANLVGFLQPVIALGNVFIGIISKLVELIGNALNPVLEFINLSIDKFALGLAELSLKFRLWKKSIEDTPLEAVLDFLGAAYESGLGVGLVFDKINEAIKITTDRYKVLLGIFPELEDGQKQASAAARRAGHAARELNKELSEQEQRLKNAANASLEYLEYLESIGASVGRTEFFVANAGTATDYVGDFFRAIEDAVAKESARIKLTAMGASEGLLDAILGAQGWESVFKRVIRDGEAGLQRLQTEFNKTGAGIKELTEATFEAEKAQKALREAAQDAVNEQLKALEQEAATRTQAFESAEKAADDFRRWSLENITTIQVLPDVEKELGRFESAVVSTIASMQSELQSAVRSGLIQDSDFNTLRNWVATETTELANLARSRDDLAERYSLSEALISEYQKALTGSLRLTSLFSKLKDETEKVTVTETSQGVMKLGASLREFEVTVAQSYKKTIEKVQDKTVGLLQGFRDMADKARGFAENLRKLRDMHLDPMLFNELVEAGVEAGGETAQALVDGGDETILEINSLFAEINRLGADLGMDVGQTMYEAGQDLTFGLLEGIQSEQEALYDEMVALAKGLSETFRNNLDIAVEVPVAAAQAALDTATEAVEQAKQVNVGALVQIENIIRAGLKALAGPLSAEFRQGITEKVAGLGALYRDVFSGAVTDIPGITGGMTSADLRAAAMATGGPNVTQYYNITVSGGNRLQQQQTVEEIRKFVDQNGNLSSWVSV